MKDKKLLVNTYLILSVIILGGIGYFAFVKHVTFLEVPYFIVLVMDLIGYIALCRALKKRVI